MINLNYYFFKCLFQVSERARPLETFFFYFILFGSGIKNTIWVGVFFPFLSKKKLHIILSCYYYLNLL